MSVTIILSLLCGAAAFAGLVWASASIRSRVYLHSHCRAEGCGHVIALTFDDGPDPLRTPKVLDVLARHKAQAAFFLIGEKASAHPELVRRILSEGHTIGNHTYTHSGLFPLNSSRKIREELRCTAETLARITGRKPRLFRPPFGVTNPLIGCAVRKAGYDSVGWSVRSLDTISRTPRQKVLARILRGIHDGAVILLHDRCEASAELLEALLIELERRGYAIKKPEELFHLEAYEN